MGMLRCSMSCISMQAVRDSRAASLLSSGTCAELWSACHPLARPLRPAGQPMCACEDRTFFAASSATARSLAECAACCCKLDSCCLRPATSLARSASAWTRSSALALEAIQSVERRETFSSPSSSCSSQSSSWPCFSSISACRMQTSANQHMNMQAMHHCLQIDQHLQHTRQLLCCAPDHAQGQASMRQRNLAPAQLHRWCGSYQVHSRVWADLCHTEQVTTSPLCAEVMSNVTRHLTRHWVSRVAEQESSKDRCLQHSRILSSTPSRRI